MNRDETIKKIGEFFEKEEIIVRLKDNLRKDKFFIEIEYWELTRFNPSLAEELLDNPESIIDDAEALISQFDLEKKGNNRIRIRFFNLPLTQRTTPWQFRGEDVGKFISLKGIINKSSNIIHSCRSAQFECPNCSNNINILMLDGVYREPTKCQCGRRGNMRIVNKQMEDMIKIGIADDLSDDENMSRAVAREKLAILNGDLASEEVDKQINIGKKVLVNGYFKYIQKAKTVEFESIFFVNSIEFIKIGWETVKISEKEEERIKELAKDEKIINRLAESVADVGGFNEIKKACLLALAGSPHMYDINGHLTSRGTMHLLGIGNPGVAKTYLLRRFASISPINAYQPAQNASGKGLVASVNQDKDIGTWTAYPGVVAMANKGVVCIDEIDKTHPEDYGDHNGAMNDMVVYIAKANIKAKLETETSYLATANPENRIFVKEISFYEQINMPKDFIDRFDIIFPMESPTKEEDKEQIMDIMLDRHLGDSEKTKWVPEFKHDFITKYISYCRRNNPNPKLPKSLFSSIKERLHKLMKPKSDSNANISFRQLESILRFAYASARLRLRDISEVDIDLAFELKENSFIALNIIDERGEFSWAKLENINEKAISEKQSFMDTLEEFFSNNPDVVEVQAFINMCTAKGVREYKAEEWISRLLRDGEYFERSPGWIKKL